MSPYHKSRPPLGESPELEPDEIELPDEEEPLFPDPEEEADPWDPDPEEERVTAP